MERHGSWCRSYDGVAFPRILILHDSIAMAVSHSSRTSEDVSITLLSYVPRRTLVNNAPSYRGSRMLQSPATQSYALFQGVIISFSAAT